MAPREAREDREKKILQTANAVIAKHGFLDLKMSEVAREVEISVGTLYAHFPSKEDLLLGVCIDYALKKETIFKELLAHESWSPVEKMAAIILADIGLHQRAGEMSEIETLSMLPSVWKRASQSFILQLDAVADRISNMVQANIDEAIGQNLFKLDVKNQGIGVVAIFWGMAVGLRQIFNSYCIERLEELRGDERERVVSEAICRLTRGMECPQPLNLDDIQRLSISVQNSLETLSP